MKFGSASPNLTEAQSDRLSSLQVPIIIEREGEREITKKGEKRTADQEKGTVGGGRIKLKKLQLVASELGLQRRVYILGLDSFLTLCLKEESSGRYCCRKIDRDREEDTAFLHEGKDAWRMWKNIRDREAGKLRPNSFANRVKSDRISSLQLSNHKDIVSPHKGSVNSLQVDLTEGRYLLSGASDASAAVFDIQRATHSEGLIAKHQCIFAVDKQHEHGHKYAISSAIWYPIDTGLFVTGSYDHYINVWDTNTTQVVVNFKLPGKVYRTAMSSLATSHMLIAAGTEDVQVRLCDISSGAFSHTLSGHRDGIMSVEWSASSEWVLITGGCDGAIRFWDIRRAGCFRVLDQSQSQLGRRPPITGWTATNKLSTSKSLLASQGSNMKSRAPHKKLANGNLMKPPSIGKLPAKGSTRQRLHPGLLSSQDRATVHYGAVTGLKVTEDGMYLLSAGSDSRLKLWDVESGCNTLVNYETMRLQINKPLQLATSQDSALVFAPCMTTVKAFDMWTGKTSLTFSGHYEGVNCCWFSFPDQELYTGGNDRQILVWSPSRNSTELDWESTADKDNWSD